MQAGLIINIGSIAAESGMAAQAVYSATKWGLRGWSYSCYEVQVLPFLYLQCFPSSCTIMSLLVMNLGIFSLPDTAVLS